MIQPDDGEPAAPPRVAPPIAPARGSGFVETLLGIEQRARAAYDERMGSPGLAAIDARLRRAYGSVRRCSAVPIYLRQRLELLHGRCGSEPAAVAAWGRAHDLRAAIRPLFDDAATGRDAGARTLPAFLALVGAADADLDLVVASTTPLVAGALRRRGFVVIPAAIQLAATLDTLRAVAARPCRSLRSDQLRVERAGYRLVPWPYSPDRARLFQERYLEPYARSRFTDDATVPTLERVDRAYRGGLALAALAPGGEMPDLLCVAHERAGLLRLLRLGVRDADPALLRRGAIAALYALAPGFAESRGLRGVHVGRSRPWLGEGVLAFKWKWGYRPIENPAQTLEWAVLLARPDAAVARRFLARRPIVRGPHGLVPLDPIGDRRHP